MCFLIKIIRSYGLDDLYFLLMTNIPSAQISLINLISGGNLDKQTY